MTPTPLMRQCTATSKRSSSRAATDFENHNDRLAARPREFGRRWDTDMSLEERRTP